MQNDQTEDNDNDNASEGSDDNQSVQSNRTTSSRNRRRGSTRNNQNQSRHSWFNGFTMYNNNELCDQELVYKQTSEKLSGLRNKIILDSGCTIGATFMNPDLLTDIGPSDNPIRMSTNTGNMRLDTEGTFDESMIANILGFSHVKKKHRITYDSAVEDAFNVHTDAGIVKFECTDEGLYAYEPGPDRST